MIRLHSEGLCLYLAGLSLTVICRPRRTWVKPQYFPHDHELRRPAAILTLRTPDCRWQLVSRVGGARAP